MVTDDDLLAACRSAGKPGSESHRAACRLYRQSVLEWRQRDQAVRRAEAERAVFLVLHDTARLVWAGMIREQPWREAA